MHVTDSGYTPLAKAFVEAGVELGYPALDVNGAENIGKADANVYQLSPPDLFDGF